MRCRMLFAENGHNMRLSPKTMPLMKPETFGRLVGDEDNRIFV